MDGRARARARASASTRWSAWRRCPGCSIYGPPATERGGVAVLLLGRMRTRTTWPRSSTRDGIAVRAGHHCAMPLHEQFGLPATTRASFYLYTTRRTLTSLVDGLYKVKHDLRLGSAAWTTCTASRSSTATSTRSCAGRSIRTTTPTRTTTRLCGDRLRIDMRVDADKRVSEAAFSGQGCAISQASADLLTEAVVGKTLDEVKAMTKDDILDMLGIELGPVRLKCALLSLKVLKAGVYGIDQLEADLA